MLCLGLATKQRCSLSIQTLLDTLPVAPVQKYPHKWPKWRPEIVAEMVQLLAEVAWNPL